MQMRRAMCRAGSISGVTLVLSPGAPYLHAGHGDGVAL
jgi:hypothetical protein